MKKYAYALTASAVALMFAASAAVAGHGPQGHGDRDGKGPKHEHIMEKLDTDSDGFISKDEFMAVHEKRFGEMDGDGDGKLTAEEMKESWAKFKKKRHEKRMEMKKDGETRDGGAPAREEKTEDAGDSEGAAE